MEVFRLAEHIIYCGSRCSAKHHLPQRQMFGLAAGNASALHQALHQALHSHWVAPALKLTGRGYLDFRVLLAPNRRVSPEIAKSVKNEKSDRG
jgi:hypothetical protein